MGEPRSGAVQGLSWATFVLGGLVWLGYLTHSPWLGRLQPGTANANMTAVTAAGLMLAALVLLLRSGWRWLALAALFSLSVAEAVAILANLARAPWELMQWSAWAQGDALHPGRSSPVTIVGFLLFGAAALLLPGARNQRWGRVLRWLTVAVIATGVAGALGFFLHLDLLFSNYEIARMAFGSSFGLVLLGLALWFGWKGNRWNRSIEGEHGRRIMTAAALVLVGVVVAAGFGSLLSLQRLAARDAALNLSLRLDERINYVQLLVQQALARGNALAGQPALAAVLRGRGADLFESPGGFSSTLLYGPQGQLKLQLGRPTVGGRPSVQVKPSADLFWDNEFFLRQRLAVAPNGQFLGTVEMEQPLLLLGSIGVDTATFGESGEIALCGRSPGAGGAGVCFPQRLHHVVSLLHPGPSGIEHPMELALSGKRGIADAIDYRRRRVLAAYGPVPGLNLGLVVKMDSAELYGPVRRQLEIIVPLLLLLVMGGLEWMRWRLRPLVEALVESRNAAMTSEARFRAAAESGLDPFYIFHSTRSECSGEITGFRLLYANRPGEELANLTSGGLEMLGLSAIPRLAAVHDILPKLRQVVVSRQGLAEEVRVSAAANENGQCPDPQWISLQAVPLGDGVAVTMRDISVRKQEEERLIVMAQTDPLTGLANRRAFYKRLVHAMESSRRLRRQRLLAVLYLDIDHFKEINDSLGHAFGDHILQVFAARLLNCVRAADTVARPGGDEFTVLLENLDARSDAERVVAAIFSALHAPVEKDGHVVPLLTSVGVAYFAGGAINADELLRRADNALYAAKRGGRNQFRVYGEEI